RREGALVDAGIRAKGKVGGLVPAEPARRRAVREGCFRARNERVIEPARPRGDQGCDVSHRMPETKRAVLIAGPTASGKSALALRLAETLGGVVINADSMQVYRDLRVITARPTEAEEARVPHRLYGHVDAAENYSTGRWCRDVADVLAAAAREGRVPIFVGGTGLYFKALTSGLAAVPPIPADIREDVRGRLAREGVAPLYAELLERDPKTAHRLMPNDRSRIWRARSDTGDRTIALGLARARPAAFDRRRARRQGVHHLRAHRVGAAHRGSLRQDARCRRARGGAG